MNFETLKIGFQSYLEELTKDTDKPVTAQSGSVSIFMYSSEFKDYLVDEIGADVSIFTKSINEILQMDFENGKLVEKEDETNSDSFEKETDDTSEFMTDALNEAFADENVIAALDSDKSGDLNQEEINIFLNGLADEENGNISFDSLAAAMTEIQNGEFSLEETADDSETGQTETDKITELLNNVYTNKTVIKTLDLDGDGELSDEEKAKFEEFIKGYDGDDSKLSEEDIKMAVQDIIDGKFSYDITSDTVETDEDTVQETTQTESSTAAGDSSDSSVSNTGSTNSSGGVSSANTSGGSTTASETTASDTNSLNNMSLEELETERTKRQGEVDEARQTINDVYAGNTDAMQEAQAEYEDAREAYDEAVENDENISQDLKDRREENLDAIESQQSIIDNLNIDINNKEGEISSQESVVSADESNLSSLKSALSVLNGQSSDDSEKQAEIEAKKAELESAIAEAEEQLEQDEQTLKNLEEELSELKTQLEEEETTLAELEEERSEIEQEITETCSPETKAALQAFNEAKENVQTVKDSELRSAKADLTEAQSALDEVNNQIEIKKAEETEEEYSVSTSTLPDGIFTEGGALEGKEDLVAEIAEKYDIEPEFLAAIICLESARGTSNLAVNYNNFGGVTGSGDAGSVTVSTGYTFACYSSVEAGLEAMAKNLAAYDDRYSDVNSVDIDNVDAIGSHYCVGGDWANKIKQLYAEIKGE